jgi:hypothetical protein
MAVSFASYSQQDTTLAQYVGKFKFPDGSPVSEVNVTFENGVLLASSAMGSTELKRSQGDVFEVIAYGGIATFKRNDSAKIIGVRIEVGDLVLEGTKAEPAQLQLAMSEKIRLLGKLE